MAEIGRQQPIAKRPANSIAYLAQAHGLVEVAWRYGTTTSAAMPLTTQFFMARTVSSSTPT